MQINVIYDQNVNTLPAGFTATVSAVAQYFQSQFTDPVTFNLHVGFGEVHATAVNISGNYALYNSGTYLYSELRKALAADASSQDDVTAVGSLPDSFPSQGMFTVTNVQAVALGLISPVSPVDAYIGFSSSPGTFDFDRSDGITSGQYDFYGLVAHELSAVMGRVSLADKNWNQDTALDLYSYSGPDHRHFALNDKADLTSQGYFSIDSGTTNLNYFDNKASHADWAGGTPDVGSGNFHVIAGSDAFESLPNTGVELPITDVDLRELDVIGYDRTGSNSIPQDHAETISNSDFNGDGKGDILWRYYDGTVGAWTVDDHKVPNKFNLGKVGFELQILATGDFNGDGTSDLLWRDRDGTLGTWFISGQRILSNGSFGRVDNHWHVVGTGDFNGDGVTDILWRHTDGSVGTWDINPNQAPTTFNFGVFDNRWHIAGTGDFNGDGKSDILWRNDDGSVGTWDMNDHQVISTFNFGSFDMRWQIAGTGDFNGDGFDDILWRHDDGSVGIWYMADHQVLSTINFGQFDNRWHIAGTGDFNGDGTADILWRNDDGSIGTWDMGDHQVLSTFNFGVVDNHWHIA